MMKRVFTALRKSPFYKGFFLLLPYVLAVAVIFSGVILVYQEVVSTSEYYRVFTGNADTTAGERPSTPPGEVVPDKGHIPVIPFESQWATLNVDGWEERDIPVYFGDSKAILKKGAGMWFNSRFCGQGGKTVLSAHVTRHFYEIEDTVVGTRITMDTVYGQYVYEVSEIKIFSYKDSSLIKQDGSQNTLVMYTCYPRKNGYQTKAERMALVCTMVSGKEWATYG
ncbi:MAG: sortase [Clostridia bacterium]|nr:sortase [Clostridia bacterium]